MVFAMNIPDIPEVVDVIPGKRGRPSRAADEKAQAEFERLAQEAVEAAEAEEAHRVRFQQEREAAQQREAARIAAGVDVLDDTRRIYDYVTAELKGEIDAGLQTIKVLNAEPLTEKNAGYKIRAMQITTEYGLQLQDRFIKLQLSKDVINGMSAKELTLQIAKEVLAGDMSVKAGQAVVAMLEAAADPNDVLELKAQIKALNEFFSTLPDAVKTKLSAAKRRKVN